MPKIVDTTIRLLSQDPLAGKLPTGEVLRIAEILDAPASRTSRSRAAACSTPPSGGRREPVGADPGDRRPHDDAPRPRPPRPLPRRLAPRLGRHRPALRRLCGRERHRRLPAPRPLNDVSNLPRQARRSWPRARSSTPGWSSAPGGRGDRRARRTREAAAGARRLPRDRQRPDRLAAAAPDRGLVERIGEATGLPVGLFVQGAAGTGLLNAVVATRLGADLIATGRLPARAHAHRSGGSLVERSRGSAGRPV